MKGFRQRVVTPQEADEKLPNARQMRRIMAEKISQRAEALAPRGKSRGPGVAESFRVTDGRYKEVDAGEVRVESTDPFFHLTEFGSKNNPAYAPLRRAVREAGFELAEDDKQVRPGLRSDLRVD